VRKMQFQRPSFGLGRSSHAPMIEMTKSSNRYLPCEAYRYDGLFLGSGCFKYIIPLAGRG
jgi:hypothetical protein